MIVSAQEIINKFPRNIFEAKANGSSNGPLNDRILPDELVALTSALSSVALAFGSYTSRPSNLKMSHVFELLATG